MKNKMIILITLVSLVFGAFLFLYKNGAKEIMSAETNCQEEKVKLGNPHYAVLVECPAGSRRSGLMSGVGGEIYVKCLCK